MYSEIGHEAFIHLIRSERSDERQTGCRTLILVEPGDGFFHRTWLSEILGASPPPGSNVFFRTRHLRTGPVDTLGASLLSRRCRNKPLRTAPAIWRLGAAHVNSGGRRHFRCFIQELPGQNNLARKPWPKEISGHLHYQAFQKS